MQTLLKALLVAFFSFGLVACEPDGPFERAGENMDDAVNEIEDEIDDRT